MLPTLELDAAHVGPKLQLCQLRHHAFRERTGEVYKIVLEGDFFAADRTLTLADITALRDWCNQALIEAPAPSPALISEQKVA